MQITKKPFGHTKYNEPVSIYRLQNSNDSYVEILDYGCRVHSIHVPDKNGVLRDVCLGYQSFSDYETDDAYFGAVVGRCVNLISNASFTLNNKTYLLDNNDGNHHLHGGKNGFSFCVWNGTYDKNKLVFSRQFPHMSDGYPGNLRMQITYEWTEDNQLRITYEAVSDEDTILNVTNHTYFNLEGSGSSSILEHALGVDADSITEVNAELLPTGNYLPLEGTPFDFRTPKSLQPLDYNFVLNGTGFRSVATLHSPNSGIRMTCRTDRPCLQIYTSNELTSRTGKYGEILGLHSGVCLEAQHYPNAINTSTFPSVVLKAKKVFRSTTIYTFDTMF